VVKQTSTVGTAPIPGTGYGLRRVVVATDLAGLRGPVSGRWQLPLHLDASARAVYDFADPDEREEAYQLVLLEAASPADLEQWLDGTELLRMWPDLYLPRVVRAAWQTEQPALAQAGAGPRVPQL
jgi:hypothetical protein